MTTTPATNIAKNASVLWVGKKGSFIPSHSSKLFVHVLVAFTTPPMTSSKDINRDENKTCNNTLFLFKIFFKLYNDELWQEMKHNQNRNQNGFGFRECVNN